MSNVFTTVIDFFSLTTLIAEVARLNKIAAKLGAAGLVLTVGEKGSRPVETLVARAVGRVVETVEITIEGTSPRIGGHTVLAKIDHTRESGNLINRAPAGYELDIAELVQADANCDHCGQNRARNTTYVLATPEGSRIQIGSTCLVDFTGHPDALRVARFIEAVEAVMENLDDEETYRSGNGPVTFVLADVLVLAIACIRRWGWTSRAKAFDGQCATSDDLRRQIIGRTSDDLATSVAMEEQADDIITWAKGLEMDGSYLGNIAVIANDGRCTERDLGLVASMVSAHNRAVADQNKAEAVAKGEVASTPEGRVEITGVVLSITWKENPYTGGSVAKMTVQHESGYRVWSTLPAAISQAGVGDTVTFTATVERSSDDVTFAFAKRPSKASILVSA